MRDVRALQLVDMNTIGAGDITTGQEWIPVIAEPRFRVPWRVVEVGFDDAALERDDETQRVSFGTLLSSWGLIDG